MLPNGYIECHCYAKKLLLLLPESPSKMHEICEPCYNYFTLSIKSPSGN